MERHQAGQEEMLMEVKVETDSMEDIQPSSPPSADRRGCLKFMIALATLMGFVIVALVTGLMLHLFILTPSCNQVAPPLNDTVKGYHLQKSDEQERFDIVNVTKGATYLIYGWVRFPDVSVKKVTLMQTNNKGQRTIETKTASKTEFSFFHKVKLADGIRISLYVSSTFTDNLFHVHEL